jgi:hypothetical protein
MLREMTGMCIEFMTVYEMLEFLCEISSSHGGEYDVQSCLLIIPDDGGSTHL